MRTASIFMLLITLNACFKIDTLFWRGYVSPDSLTLNNNQVSIFDWSNNPGMIISIDGVRIIGVGREGFKFARLNPGMHTVEYSNYVPGFGHIHVNMKFYLKPGLKYLFKFKTCYWCHPKKFAVWVTNESSGEIIWGNAP